jgi:hypothetical protein
MRLYDDSVAALTQVIQDDSQTSALEEVQETD